jgi:hypothetical protein
MLTTVELSEKERVTLSQLMTVNGTPEGPGRPPSRRCGARWDFDARSLPLMRR